MSTLLNFQNLFTANPGLSGERNTYVDRGVNLRDYASIDGTVASALTAVYTQAVGSRRDFLMEFNRLRNYYLVVALLNALIEDALTPDATTGEILQVTSPDRKINKELEELQRMFDFDQLIYEIAPDLVSFGEYSLRLSLEEGAGVVGIVDDVDQSRIICFYNEGRPYRFLRQTDRDMEIYPAYKFAHFVFGKLKTRVELKHEFLEIGNYQDPFGLPYPTYARIGQPLFWGTLSKIKELMVLEQLIPASKLNELLTGSLVGLAIPPSMAPDEAFKAARRYEQLLNRHQGVKRDSGELTIVDILSVAGKIRVIPQFGDKGQLTNISDVKESKTVEDLMNSIRDTREIILSSMGFPPEILFASQNERGPKAEFLKRYSRYLRKLKDFQQCLVKGIQQICVAHLKNRNIDVEWNDVQVIFRNQLINIDELERLEFQDTLIGIITNMNNFVMSLSRATDDNPEGSQPHPLQNFVDWEAYQAWMYKAFNIGDKSNNFIKPPPGYRANSPNISLV